MPKPAEEQRPPELATTIRCNLLIDRIRAGDESAWDELIRDAFERFRSRAHYLLRGQFAPLGRDLETGDLLSISMLKFTRRVREGLPSVPDDLGGLLGYVSQIIRRTAIDEVRVRVGLKGRVRTPQGTLPGPDALCDERSPLAEVEHRLMVEELIATLPDDERALIDLFYLQEMTDQEIADLRGEKKNTVTKRRLALVRRLDTDDSAPD